eukprot:Hpha_TRINITY_DN15292_c8_g11::TRINITY_DN15292_c8_g11_i1::g.68367::m.68367
MSEFIENLFIDPSILPQDGFGLVQLATLGAVYGYVLLSASNMISDGSELLLLTKYASLVGPVVLPILGAIPDGAMIMFSGTSQKQLAVGVGALAGSTIMLLTIPWGLASISGRVSCKNGDKGYTGVPNYRNKPRQEAGPWFSHLSTHGCSVEASIKQLGLFMLLSSSSYLLIQGPAFRWGCAEYGCGCKEIADGEYDAACLARVANDEKPWAVAGLVLSVIFFVAYLYWQYYDSMAEERMRSAMEKRVDEMLHKGFVDLWNINNRMPDLAQKDSKKGVMDRVIRKKFDQFDVDRSGEIDQTEWPQLAAHLGGEGSNSSLMQHMRQALSDDDKISFSEFVEVMTKWMNGETKQTAPGGSMPGLGNVRRGSAALEVAMAMSPATPEDPTGDEDEDEDEEEEDDEPEELAECQTEEERSRTIWKLALTGMLSGTFLVLLFADPLVGVLAEVGNRTGIPAFYIAFVLAPLASNASELIAAMNYAAKKTQRTYTISLANLLGAACMNNTFCLAIFLWQVYAHNLIWEYSAETLSIVATEIIFFVIAQKKNHLVIEAPFVLALFPLSLAFVWTLENVLHLD